MLMESKKKPKSAGAAFLIRKPVQWDRCTQLDSLLALLCERMHREIGKGLARQPAENLFPSPVKHARGKDGVGRKV